MSASLAPPFMYGFSLLHCMTVSLAQDGAGLGAAWGEQTAVRMLHEAGFRRVDVCTVDGDFVNSYYLARILAFPRRTGCEGGQVDNRETTTSRWIH